MGVTIAVTRVACNTTTGNQDITADLNGLTPKAVFFIVTHATADGTPTDHAIIGLGAATGPTERWACSTGAEHGQAASDTDRHAMKDECVVKINVGASTVDGEADFISFITNGVRISWSNAPAAAYLLTAVLFAGTDLTAKASTSALPTQDNTIDINTIGSEPDVVLFVTHNMLFNDAGSITAILSHGVAINKSPVVQACWAWASLNAKAASAVYSQFRDDYAFGQLGLASLTYAGEISDFDAQGFSITARLGNASADEVGYLALSFGGVVDFAAGVIDSPTANGNQSITAPGLKPQFVYAGITQMPAVDTHYDDGYAGSIGVATFDADNEYSNSIQDEDAAATMNTQSLSDDAAINLPQDDGAAGWVASFVSFDATGWTWDFSQTLGTATKWWYLAIQKAATLPILSTEIHSLVFGGVTVR